MWDTQILVQRPQPISLDIIRVLRSFRTTPVYIFPWHGEAEKIAPHLRSAFGFAKRNVDEIAVRAFQVVHQHYTPHRPARCTFQPSYVVVNDVSTHVAVVVVIADAQYHRRKLKNSRHVSIVFPKNRGTLALRNGGEASCSTVSAHNRLHVDRGMPGI